MWTLVTILVLTSSGEPESVEVTRNLRGQEACAAALQQRKAAGTPEAKEMYLVCIPAPSNKDSHTRSMKL